MELKRGTLLRDGKYRVEAMLGQGGFGITYRVTNVTFGRTECVKEFFLADDNFRATDGKTVAVLPSTGTRDRKMIFGEYKEKFLHEAQRQARLENNHIVAVHDLWEENGTAYYAMAYVEGESLDKVSPLGHPLDESTVWNYCGQMLDVLEYIHGKQLWHLDIKPANIMLTKGGVLKLIDFGASKCLTITTGGGTTSLMPLTEGYAPIEQAVGGDMSTLGPWSDLYALGATLYRLATGNQPPKTSDILDRGAAAFKWGAETPRLRDLVVKLMSYRRQDRPQSVAEVRRLMVENEKTIVENPPSDETTIVNVLNPPIEPEPTPKSRVEECKFQVRGVDFTLVKVEGGIFTMGANNDDHEASTSEKPAHEVQLADYYIGQTEVTQKLWDVVMGNNPSKFNSWNLPVESISWNDCQRFIAKLNEITGKRFRLPTEAEWEFAARGGNYSRGYKYPGSDDIDLVSWYWKNSYNKTHITRGKLPNELGIFDMAGNVSEWCADSYGAYSRNFQTNPIVASENQDRVY